MRRYLILALFIIISASLHSQEEFVAAFEVHSGEYIRYDTPVSLDISSLGLSLNDNSFLLYEIDGSTKKEVPVQLESGTTPRLYWILEGRTEAKTTRLYELFYGEADEEEKLIEARIEDYSTAMLKDKNPVLEYRHAMHYPPEGVPEKYKRSGFIHPLYSPGGNILTRINPPDHYHHYGIWNPWTKTHYREKQIDFWNLYLGQGTVRFAGYLAHNSGEVFGGFKALQEHISYLSQGEDLVVLNELLETKVWNVDLGGRNSAYLLDYTSILSCATNDELILDAYRYGGGLGFRATEEWTKHNSRVLTSEGKTRKNADASRGKWVDVSGDFSSGTRSGILFMSSPSNRQHPEAMRIWPEDSNNNRGDMYFEFCPIRHVPWTLKPGNEYSQKYRLLVYDGEINAEFAEQLWTDFAYPPMVTIKK